jgi:hypothetical protein
LDHPVDRHEHQQRQYLLKGAKIRQEMTKNLAAGAPAEPVTDGAVSRWASL